MKILVAFFLLNVSFLAAQDNVALNSLPVQPIVVNEISEPVLEDLIIISEETLLTKKKSFKTIIEDTLSGRKYLIFNIDKYTKLC
ncbi:hypothetical protein [Oceanihabitans sediminis]|uniref:Uncharacterized protein n=1 Tax=Oceanihabitans sediminis TaxID=1812012 RepID=A0A368P7Z4_9FLAO|nr:hypothetical protein [Oceanihabitans sediminis]MDX1277266.1 hypothetical protein [Oceanihabitans sediminis]MDX1773686.1 hypothetical protein [Oceanihabitans sediminis]RBP33131.1 hypothetical protein DFR65_102468 [Oceanihabitans sediminis]RCU57361.1 hypothetical protein DU428_06085 [Oceanihabitans sediminis]